jgi:SAM-dependent methyltransferase
MDLSKALESLLEGAPAPEAPGSDSIWTDPHISPLLLAAHLDEGGDAASRKPAAIDAAVAWILGRCRPSRPPVAARILDLGSGPSARILDLGCGPGLYAERLAAAGCEVCGIDFNEASIAHARASAASRGLSIDYRLGSYLELEYPKGLDAAIMIYCDFGALDDSGRRAVLARLRGALRPGGLFVFDVFGSGIAERRAVGRRWSVHEGGFWAPGPHLVLEEDFLYPEARSLTRQIVVVEAGGRTRVFRNHDSWFDEASIGKLLAEEGFSLEELRRDLVPPSDFASDDVLFAAARLGPSGAGP